MNRYVKLKGRFKVVGRVARSTIGLASEVVLSATNERIAEERRMVTGGEKIGRAW